MTRADIAEIGAELAHDTFDDVGAQPVVVGEPIASRGGQMAGGDALRIGADLYLVLDIALRQMSDRARAEAEQNIALVGGVALKIAPQRALLEGYGHGIAGPREMIEPDLHVTGLLQRIGDRAGLVVARKAVGQH